jgi:hypothetical protein
MISAEAPAAMRHDGHPKLEETFMDATRLAFALVLMAVPAAAQSGSTSGSMGGMGHSNSMGSMNSMNGMHHNSSMHMMPATVTSVDDKTGVMEVNSEGMALKLHFPPASLKGVKAGDKITIHMGFSKA